jgi:hypothetical protein
MSFIDNLIANVIREDIRANSAISCRTRAVS